MARHTPLLRLAALLLLAALVLRLRRIWPLAAAALLGIYACQELVEGLVSHGHPSGLAGVFGAGGWVSIPLALALGGGMALLVQVTQRVAEAAPAGAGWLAGITVLQSAPVPLRTLVSRTLGCRRRPLAFRLAGRGPPVWV